MKYRRVPCVLGVLARHWSPGSPRPLKGYDNEHKTEVLRDDCPSCSSLVARAVRTVLHG